MKFSKRAGRMLSWISVCVLVLSGCGASATTSSEDSSTRMQAVSETQETVSTSSETVQETAVTSSSEAIQGASSASSTEALGTVSSSSSSENTKADSVAGASETVQETSTTSASAEDDAASVENAFDALMDEVKETVFPGTAGASLNAAYAGADLLTWYVAHKTALDRDEIRAMRDRYISGTEDTDLFSQQLDATAETIRDLYDSGSQGILSDSGWSGDITWTQEDCTVLYEALITDSAAAEASDAEISEAS